MNNDLKPQSNSENNGMLSWSLPYGILLGLILIIQTVFFYLINISYEKWAAIISYAILMGMSYFVVRKRKKFLNSYITLGEGFKVGIITMPIAVAISSIYLYLHIQYVDTHFLEIMIEKQKSEMQANGLSEEQIKSSLEWIYKIMNPVTSSTIGFISNSITCMIFSLISAAILKNEKVKK